MINILMFGTGRSSFIVRNSLVGSVNIVAYLDNNRECWGLYIDGKQVLPPNKLTECKYDYIVIASQYNEEILKQLVDMGISKNKIFQFYKFADLYFNYIQSAMNLYNSKIVEYKGLITGISYLFTGIVELKLFKPAFKFAFASQDLYYDYKIVNHILANNKKSLDNLEYVIIGLSYYTFEYDLSLSSLRNKVLLYYEVIKDYHHFKDVPKLFKEFEANKEIAEVIFRKNKHGRIVINWDTPHLSSFGNKIQIGKEQAERDCRKNYPKTVEENVKVLKDYLKLLKWNNIKPIVIVPPASKYYTEYFSERIEGEFKSIISEIRKEYDFQYIDYFRSEIFDDDDFQDVSHLNTQGAEKFTKILNADIDW